jgi:hypothetical protein
MEFVGESFIRKVGTVRTFTVLHGTPHIIATYPMGISKTHPSHSRLCEIHPARFGSERGRGCGICVLTHGVGAAVAMQSARPDSYL